MATPLTISVLLQPPLIANSQLRLEGFVELAVWLEFTSFSRAKVQELRMCMGLHVAFCRTKLERQKEKKKQTKPNQQTKNPNKAHFEVFHGIRLLKGWWK